MLTITYKQSDSLEKECYKKTNREKSMQAKKGMFWCFCDMARIGKYGKCPMCEKR